MKLFLDNIPFSEEPREDLYGRPLRHVVILLPITMIEPDAHAPPEAPTRLEFVLDTAADYTVVSRKDLAVSGIDPDGPKGGEMLGIMADGSIDRFEMRDVTLWLHSNLPDYSTQPKRIDLNGGVVIRPDPNPNEFPPARPLLGINALLDGRLRILLDADIKRCSVWVPES
jgi:hypothetical protein